MTQAVNHMPASHPADGPMLRLKSPLGRRTVAATIVGSGMVFLDGTVVNVALPAIRSDLNADLAGLQWVLTGYLLTLGSLLLLGGSLGDVKGRRKVFSAGLVVFTIASVLCAVAPVLPVLIAARVLQGVGGALLVPQSLAIVTATFHPDDRGAAIGLWSGLAGVSTAIGPFIGGFLVDTYSWRWAFLLNVPLALVTWWLALTVPESRDPDASPRLDVPGALTVTLGLAGLVYALIEGPTKGFTDPLVAAAGVGGIVLLVAFILIERRSPAPMMPLSIFRNRRFTGANLTTVTVYAALGGGFFFIGLQLQTVMGYSALEAGIAFLPVTLFMAGLSSYMGRLAQRIGPRTPMTIGPLIAAAGFAWLSQIGPGTSYVTGVLPGIMIFGLGLAITVSPLVGAVLMSVDDHLAGTASGINNAISRVAQLLAIALLPFAAGISGVEVGTAAFAAGFTRAMLITAGLLAVGGATAFVTVRD
jgi:EmrB/QacA subfamily drug resistance transporter